MVRTLLQLKRIYLLMRLHEIPRKFFNIFLVTLIILPLLTQVQAQDAEIGTKVITDQAYPTAGTNQQVFTDAYIDSLLYSFTTKVTGETEITVSNTGAITAYTLKKRGFIADIGDLTGSLYLNRPVSLQPVISDFLANVNPVKTAEAQSFVFSGQGALAPIYKLWQISRNITYVFFSVIFIIIAFVILFRQKINGQQYVTVINALPNIIIALVVVTFSYPLAGLLIDIGNVATFAIASLVAVDLLPGATDVVKQLNNAGGGGASLNIITLLMKFFEETFTSGLGGEGATYLGTTIRSIMNVFSAFPLVGSVAAVGLGAILPFFLSIAIASAVFRLFIGLIMNYVEIIMKVIMSPFALIGTALSGPSTIGEWMKDMLSNILVFPGVFAGICVISIFLFTGTNGCQYTATHEGTACILWTKGDGISKGNINDTSIRYVPAPIGYYSTDVNGAPNPFILNGLVGLGLLLFLPDMIDIIKKSVKSGKGPDISGENIKGAFRRIPVVGGFIK